PSANGSGMDEVISFLNGNYNTKSYTYISCFVRYFAVWGICVAGFFTGFDGPYAQI
ncbi:hypothetical protein HK096_000949, partial [Nowakowskiella sp. JEL0078]